MMRREWEETFRISARAGGGQWAGAGTGRPEPSQPHKDLGGEEGTTGFGFVFIFFPHWI